MFTVQNVFDLKLEQNVKYTLFKKNSFALQNWGETILSCKNRQDKLLTVPLNTMRYNESSKISK